MTMREVCVTINGLGPEADLSDMLFIGTKIPIVATSTNSGLLAVFFGLAPDHYPISNL
jgi:hypothetical protein